MIGAIWRFVNRHRKKVFVAGGMVVAFYFLRGYFSRQIAEMNRRRTAATLEKAQKDHHFTSSQRTCNITILSLLPKLSERIDKLVGKEEIKLALQAQSQSENKLELWNRLKVATFTHTVALLYATNALALFLRVQVNILSGYMYVDSMSNSQGAVGKRFLSADLQKRYLSMVEYFLEDGITHLVNTVQCAVQQVMGPLALKQSLTTDDMLILFRQIRSLIEPTETILTSIMTWVYPNFSYYCWSHHPAPGPGITPPGPAGGGQLVENTPPKQLEQTTMGSTEEPDLQQDTLNAVWDSSGQSTSDLSLIGQAASGLSMIGHAASKSVIGQSTAGSHTAIGQRDNDPAPDWSKMLRLSRETEDTLSGVDFIRVFKICVQYSFSYTVEMIRSNTSTSSPVVIATAPLAKLIPVVDKVGTGMCNIQDNVYMHGVLNLQPVQNLAANVYDKCSRVRYD